MARIRCSNSRGLSSGLPLILVTTSPAWIFARAAGLPGRGCSKIAPWGTAMPRLWATALVIGRTCEPIQLQRASACALLMKPSAVAMKTKMNVRSNDISGRVRCARLTDNTVEVCCWQQEFVDFRRPVAQNKLSEGNAEAGRTLTLQACTGCHIVVPDQPIGPMTATVSRTVSRARKTFSSRFTRDRPLPRFQGHRKQTQYNGGFVETFSGVSTGNP
jgi:hypothetical protein